MLHTALIGILLSLPAYAAPKSASTPLIDAWYTITINKTTHYGYYNDHLEKKADGNLFFTNKVWKNEEGFTNQEQLGALAKDDADLTPIIYNFHATYRSTGLMIDGTVADGKSLTVKVRQGNEEPQTFSKTLPPRTFFEVFFPVWISRHLNELKSGKSLAFSTILEDNLESKFEAVNGKATLEAPDDLAKKTKATKLLIEYKGIRSFWWVDSHGVAVRIDVPGQKQVVEKVTQAEARKFLSQ